jgi:hypothetical protein
MAKVDPQLENKEAAVESVASVPLSNHSSRFDTYICMYIFICVYIHIRIYIERYMNMFVYIHTYIYT